jgi:hypothetical protein
MSAPTYAARGSQRWLQIAIAEAPELLRYSLVDAGAVGSSEPVTWSAPLAFEGFAEPRDEEALRKAGILSLPNRSLNDFWPRRGPVWDAVGKVGRASLFVEAKAHVKEAESPPSQASPASLSKINAALAEAREFYAKGSMADWHLTYYQYANRLAHHYLLTQLNELDSRLVFLYFVNATDMNGPSRAEEWVAVTNRIHAALGLPADLQGLGIYHAFLDVRALPNAP